MGDWQYPTNESVDLFILHLWRCVAIMIVAMQRLFLFTLVCAGLYAQPNVTLSNNPPDIPITTLMFRDGSNNVEYMCKANSQQPTFAWYAAGNTPVLTSIVDSANTATVTTATAHGLQVGNRITIQGVVADTDLNGNYVIATVPTDSTFTITTANVTDGTYNGSGNPAMLVWTIAPRTNALIWSISRMYYTTTFLDRISWANGDTSFTKACTLRATYAFN
jgi:hypothetical protein